MNSPRPTSKLYVVVAIAIAVVASIFAIMASSYFYFDVAQRERQSADNLISQLALTVKKTAEVASFVNNVELAQEIVDGLVANDLVANAAIRNNNGKYLAGVVTVSKTDKIASSVSFPLYHPFFDDELLGSLEIVPDQNFIAQKAETLAKRQAVLLLLYTALVVLAVSYLVHRMLTAPLALLTKEFAKITPGQDHHIAMLKHHQHDEIGALVTGINQLLDSLNTSIVEERRLRQKTEVLEQKFRLIFESASAGICLIDEKNLLLVFNPAFAKLVSADNVCREEDDLTAAFEDQHEIALFLEQLRGNDLETVAMDLKLKRHESGHSRWVHCLFSKLTTSMGQEQMMIEVLMYDVTERTMEESMTRFEADHDPLTRLKNRRSGERLLQDMLNRAQEQRRVMVVMLIDLDAFKPINDKFGHDAGDIVLKEVSERMVLIAGADAVCIRWGGDEFVLAYLLDDINPHVLTAALAQELLAIIALPIYLDSGEQCKVGASIGMALYPYNGLDLARLLDAADIAMYQVKESGKQSYAFVRKLEA
ncbi:MAG: diguanylate cyclase domain-containing protein [Shewanella sp.]